MAVYTYSEARQKLARVLNEAEATGKVLIRRQDGRTFAVIPEKKGGSPLDVPAVRNSLKPGELVEIIREGRESGRG